MKFVAGLLVIRVRLVRRRVGLGRGSRGAYVDRHVGARAGQQLQRVRQGAYVGGVDQGQRQLALTAVVVDHREPAVAAGQPGGVSRRVGASSQRRPVQLRPSRSRRPVRSATSSGTRASHHAARCSTATGSITAAMT